MKRGRFVREHDGTEYVPSNEDVEWLAKSLWGEGGSDITRTEAAAVAWTMMRRFLLWPGDRWDSFTQLVRSFSQPVNPAWLDPSGPKCRKHPDYCQDSHIRRRRKIQGASWGDVPEKARLHAVSFLAGVLPDQLGAEYVDFASTPRARRIGRDVGGNFFLTKSQTDMGWLPGGVRVDPQYAGPELPDVGWEPSTPGTLPTTLAILAWAGLTAWAVKKVFFE